MKRLLFACLSAVLLAVSQPAQAANQSSADFATGSRLGLSLLGLSYDLGLGPVSLGLAVTTPKLANTPFSSPSYGYPCSWSADATCTMPQNDLRYSLRGVWRFAQFEGLSVGALGALHFDPGFSGNRNGMIPELGVSMAYDFRTLSLPFALRLNVGLGLNPPPSAERREFVSTSFLQQISVGPSTSLEVAWLINEHFEVTVGGGGLIGGRAIF